MNLKEGFVLPYLRNLKPPLYRRIIQKARSIEGVLTLLSGNPDFETPKHITEAAIEALKNGLDTLPRAPN